MKKKMHVLLFLVSFVVMGLEMTATRLIVPSFGNTVYTWGIVISLFLISSSVGYVLGGKSSDNPKKEGFVLCYLLITILSIVCIIPLKTFLLPHLSSLSSVLGTTIGVTLLYFIPNLLLSALVPIFTKNALEMKLTGTEIGSLHTSSSLGSVFGTLVVSFLLIPSFTITSVLVILNSFLVISFIYYFISSKSVPMPLYLCVSLLIFVPYFAEPITEESLLYHHTSLYNDIFVYSEKNEKGEEIRTLTFGNLDTIQGKINLSHPNEHQFNYVNNIIATTDALVDSPNRIFMIGHGIGSLTTHFEEKGIPLKTAEIDPTIEEVSRSYFGYKGNSVVIGDGRYLLQKEKNKYDLIILDAYRDTSNIPFHLVTKEFFEVVNEKSSSKSVLLINAIGTPKQDKILSSIHSTLQSVFPYVYVLGSNSETDNQNLILVASKHSLSFGDIPNLHLFNIQTGPIIYDEDTNLKELNG